MDWDVKFLKRINNRKSSPLALPSSIIMMCTVDSISHPVFSQLCLSGSSDFRPRNKSKIVSFPSAFRWKLIIKSGTVPRGDTGEEPRWVCKELQMRWHTYLCCIKVTVILPYQTENVTTIWTVRYVLLGKWFFSLCICSAVVGWFSNKYVRPFIGKKLFLNNGKSNMLVVSIWVSLS